MDDIAERWARDPKTGKTYTVSGSMTYKQWAAKQEGLAKSVKPLEKSTESGINRKIDMVAVLIDRYPGTKETEWQKVKGIGYIDYQGENYKAVLHWYQEPSVGKVEWKVKPDADGNWFIDED